MNNFSKCARSINSYSNRYALLLLSFIFYCQLYSQDSPPSNITISSNTLVENLDTTESVRVCEINVIDDGFSLLLTTSIKSDISLE